MYNTVTNSVADECGYVWACENTIPTTKSPFWLLRLDIFIAVSSLFLKDLVGIIWYTFLF